MSLFDQKVITKNDYTIYNRKTKSKETLSLCSCDISDAFAGLGVSFIGLCFTAQNTGVGAYYGNTKIRKKGLKNKQIKDGIDKGEQAILDACPFPVLSVGCNEKHANGLPHRHTLLVCRSADYMGVLEYLYTKLNPEAITTENLNFEYILKERTRLGRISGVQKQKILTYKSNMGTQLTGNFYRTWKILDNFAQEYWRQFTRKRKDDIGWINDEPQSPKNWVKRVKKMLIVNNAPETIKTAKKQQKKALETPNKQVNFGNVTTSQGAYHLELSPRYKLTQKELKKLKKDIKKCKKLTKKQLRAVALGIIAYYTNKRPKIAKFDNKSSTKGGNEIGQQTVNYKHNVKQKIQLE